MAGARPTALRRIGGCTRGSCRRRWARGPGRSRCWWPGLGVPNGRGRMGHTRTRRRRSPGASWRAWCAGCQSTTASVWGIQAMAPARPHGFATDPGVTSHGCARVLVTPPSTHCRPRARLAPWDVRGRQASTSRPHKPSWRTRPGAPALPWPGLVEGPEPLRSSLAWAPGPASGRSWWRVDGCPCMMAPGPIVRRMS
jgi:hypothetical protein